MKKVWIRKDKTHMKINYTNYYTHKLLSSTPVLTLLSFKKSLNKALKTTLSPYQQV
jgi:hypothetical protein